MFSKWTHLLLANFRYYDYLVYKHTRRYLCFHVFTSQHEHVCQKSRILTYWIQDPILKNTFVWKANESLPSFSHANDNPGVIGKLRGGLFRVSWPPTLFRNMGWGSKKTYQSRTFRCPLYLARIRICSTEVLLRFLSSSSWVIRS